MEVVLRLGWGFDEIFECLFMNLLSVNDAGIFPISTITEGNSFTTVLILCKVGAQNVVKLVDNNFRQTATILLK